MIEIPVSLRDIVVTLPMIVILAMSLIPVMMKVFNQNREPNGFVTLAYGVLGLAFAMGLVGSMYGVRHTAFSGAIVFDGLVFWSSLLILGAALFAVCLGYRHIDQNQRQFSESMFLTLGSVLGMLVLIMSNDLIVTFLGIETMSLCLYILIAMSREEVLAKEAALKYFVLGSFASAIFLYGIALTYGTVGSTTFVDFATRSGDLLAEGNRLFYVALIFLVLGFAFKVSVFPLHFWTPDVYQGSPTPVTAFMATAVKAASFVAFLRLLQPGLVENPLGDGAAAAVDVLSGLASEPRLATALSWLAVLTMTVGNAAALIQTDFKRILAYSSVSHSGYIMVGLIAAIVGSGYESAVTVVLYYLISYSVMTLGAFAVVGVLERKWDRSISINDFKGLARKHPYMAAGLAIVMFSLAGVPPSLGFMGKFGLFSLAVERDLYWLAVWGVLNSVIAVYYYLRPVVLMYMADPEFESSGATSSGASISGSSIAMGGGGSAASAVAAAGSRAETIVNGSTVLSLATLAVMALLTIAMGLLASPIFEAIRASL